MGRVGVLTLIIMLIMITAVAEAEVRAGELSFLDVDNNVLYNTVTITESDSRTNDSSSSNKRNTSGYVVTIGELDDRAGGLEPIKVDKSIPDCGYCHERTIILNVEFNTDKADIKPEYKNDIKKVADQMKKCPKAFVVLEGHTDDVGSAVYNQKLSERRADSVRQYLIKNFGIEDSRLKIAGFGKSRPIFSNDTEGGRQNNRRVEASFKFNR
ncbi:MAG: OmpA family protein [Syntrophaceae bacterium]|nr:OmpA family protein [Syntrophaceae bacterium]